MVGVTGDTAEIPVRVGGETVLERFDRRTDGGQRGAQIVPDGGEEDASLLLGRLQASGHLIDGFSGHSQLVSSVDSGPSGEIAAGDPSSSRSEPLEVRSHRSTDRNCKRHAQRSSEGERQEHEIPVVIGEKHGLGRQEHGDSGDDTHADAAHLHGQLERSVSHAPPDEEDGDGERRRACVDRSENDSLLGGGLHGRLGHDQAQTDQGGGDDDEAPHGSNRYPTPQTVVSHRGSLGSDSILVRIRRMWTVTVAGSCHSGDESQTCSRS